MVARPVARSCSPTTPSSATTTSPASHDLAEVDTLITDDGLAPRSACACSNHRASAWCGPDRRKEHDVIAADRSHRPPRGAVADKEEAIRRAAGLLAEHGHIAPEYAESMLGREKVANTYLGSGIAIPHGLLKDRDLIRATGIAVLQVPDGVEWNPGETVHLVVGDRRRVRRAPPDPRQPDPGARPTRPRSPSSSRRTDPQSSCAASPRAGAEPAAPRSQPADRPRRLRLAPTWCCDLAAGLHARPATAFVDLAKGFASDVRVRCGDEGGQRQEPRRAADARRRARRRAHAARPMAPTRTMRWPPSSPPSTSGLGDEDDAGTRQPRPAPSTVPPGDRRAGRRGARHRRVARAGDRPAVAPQAPPPRRRAHRQGSRGRGAEAALRRGVGASRAARPARRGRGPLGRPEGGHLPGPRGLPRRSRSCSPRSSAVDPQRRSPPGGRGARRSSRRAGELEKVDDPLLAARATDLRRRRQPRAARSWPGSTTTDAELPGHPVVLVADDLTPSDTAAHRPGARARLLHRGRRADVAHGDHRPRARHPGHRRRRPGGAGSADRRHVAVLDGSGGTLVGRRRRRRPRVGAAGAAGPRGGPRRASTAPATSRRSPPTATASRSSPTSTARARRPPPSRRAPRASA